MRRQFNTLPDNLEMREFLADTLLGLTQDKLSWINIEALPMVHTDALTITGRTIIMDNSLAQEVPPTGKCRL
jgi:hypothetical protein